MPIQIKPNGQPVKIVWFGDLGIPSGFGRIANHVTRNLVARNWQLVGASLQWGGYPFYTGVPFPVRPLGGKDPNTMWGELGQFIAAEQPDIVVVCQDFPYAVSTFHNLRLDWSLMKFICVTPIDGTPIHPQWLSLVDLVDATMVISRFGVEAMSLAGKQVDLLHPGVDMNEFYPAEDADEVKALREKIGIPPSAFVTGSFMMNQGRKMVSQTIAQFIEFARDKPDAYLFMDMERQSGGGWDIPALLEQISAPPDIVSRIRYREDAFKAGMLGLRERYLLCDISCQMAHREGFGLPNLESMACRVPPMVLDWCSGSEIAADGRAALVRRIPYMEHGTWGGARDAFPDMADWLAKWNALYRDKDLRAEMAGKGFKWAKEQTWDRATDQFEETLKRVVEQQRKERAKNEHSGNLPSVTPALSDTGDSRAKAAVPEPPIADAVDNRPGVQQPAEGDRMPQSPVGDDRLDADRGLMPG